VDKGGAENHLFDLCKMQKTKKHKVHVIYFKGNSYWKKELNAHGVSTSFYDVRGLFGFFNLMFNIIKINNFLKLFQPDIIHCHLSLSEIYGLIIKLIFKQKYRVIISKHLDSLLFEGSYGKKVYNRGLFFEKLIFKHVDHTICISNNVKNYFYSNLNLKNKNISTVYYGVKYENLQHKINIKKKYRFKKNTIYICNVARHIKQKNLFFLLDAFKNILERYKNKKKFKLILVGSGPENLNLKKYAKSLNIYDKINWIEFSDNVREIISLSNVFCLTSDYEGLGLVLLEAMSTKTPIVATNTSAIPEVIENYKTGILYNKNDKKNLINSIEKILFNKKLKNNITKNAFKKLGIKFSIIKMYKKTNSIYRRVLN
jgi:glycosyltransferase involved in cell wall biosynthesis